MIPPVKYSETTPAVWARLVFMWPAKSPAAEKRRVIIEVGPGRGDFLFHLAEKNPDALVVGIEIKGKRVDRLIRRIQKRGLLNIRLIQDDARNALPRDFGDNHVDEIHINFPDPWPKKRHEKNRAVSAEFLSQCARVLKPGGSILIATDHENYAGQIRENAACVKGLASASAGETELYPTLFATKWKKEGRKFFCQKYQKEGS